jgi:hypothetical protein
VFRVDQALLAGCRDALSGDARIHWLLGGAGSGKSTVCRELRSSLGVTVLDMDSRIYGSFHALFSPARHPVSCEWSAATDGLSWLLDMTWDEFDSFNRASLPEYLDLLAREVRALDSSKELVVDGGLCNPSLLATVIEPSRIVCLRRNGLDASALWSEPGERSKMRDAVMALDESGAKWSRFLEFNDCITSSILAECECAAIPVCVWDESQSASDVAARVTGVLGLSGLSVV